MECNKIKEMLPLYIEGELNDDELLEVKEHLDGCDKCKTEFKNLIVLMEKLKELPQLELPEGLHEDIIEKIKEEKIEKSIKNNKKVTKEKRNFKVWIVKHRGLVSALSTAACFFLVWTVSNSGIFGRDTYDSSSAVGGNNKQYMDERYNQNSVKSEEFYDFATSENDAENFVLNSSMYILSGNLTETKENTILQSAKTEAESEELEKAKTESNMQKKIIKTADISVEVKDFDYTIEILKSITEDCGGYVEDFNSHISFKDTSKDIELKSGDITLKIPSEYYDEVIGQAEKLGDVTQNREYVEDITSQYMDTESLLKAKRLEEERLFAIMEKADTVDELITIESRLGEIRSEIEVYTNRINNWDRLVKYSTINVNISQKKETTIEVISPKFGEKVFEGFISSVNTTKEFVENVVILVVSSIPAVMLTVILAGIIFLIVKLTKKKKK